MKVHVHLLLCSGLLLPKIVVDDFGGSRSDPGMLGSGIYFAGSARYTEGCVVLLVFLLCRVAYNVCMCIHVYMCITLK